MKSAVVLILTALLVMGAWADVQSSSPLTSVGVQTQETSLGDLIADAVRAAAGTPIAIIPAGGLREITIPAGAIPTSEIVKCLQYPNDEVAVITLTGGQLLKALERSVSIYPQKNMGFLQVSGLTFSFDPSAQKESRVKSASIGAEGVAPNRSYRVATTKPLADGAYGYFTIWKDATLEMKAKTISQAATDFLAQRTSVDYRVLNRIASH